MTKTVNDYCEHIGQQLSVQITYTQDRWRKKDRVICPYAINSRCPLGVGSVIDKEYSCPLYASAPEQL